MQEMLENCLNAQSDTWTWKDSSLPAHCDFFLHSFLVFSTFLMVYTLPALATVAPLVHIIQHVISKTFTDNWVSKQSFIVLILKNGLKIIFFRNKTFLFFKVESWNFREISQNFNSIGQPIEKFLWGFTKFYFKQMLKVLFLKKIFFKP